MDLLYEYRHVNFRFALFLILTIVPKLYLLSYFRVI